MKANESQKYISFYKNSREKKGNKSIFLKEKSFSYNKKEQSGSEEKIYKLISMFGGTLVSSNTQLYSIIDL